MVELAVRPLLIESPSVTARDVRWESYEELAEFLASHAEPGAEPEIFKNEDGQWVRWWAVDDPDTKRINPQTGELETRTYYVQRRVALQCDTVDTPPENRRWDFVLPAARGATLYGRPYVWMHEQVKPETDPGFFYAREHDAKRVSVATRDEWKSASAQQTAAFIEQQQKLRQTTGLTQVIQAAVEVQSPAPVGGKVK